MMAIGQDTAKKSVKLTRGLLYTYPLSLGGVEGRRGRLGVQVVRFGYWRIANRVSWKEKRRRG
jgi:hypothetical protein